MIKKNPSNRPRRVADLIARELAKQFNQSIRDPRLATISITDVDVSPDLKNAKVFFTMLDTAHLKDTNKALYKASGHFRSILAKKLELRRVPELHFIYDFVLDSGERITHLLTDIKLDENTDDER